MRFHILDVFAEKRFGGNPLAVVELPAPLPAREMQALAAEFNFPETTFILKPEKGRTVFKVRIFTPRREVPFAGHPTLGTAYIVRKRFAGLRAREVFLDLKVGRVPVTFDDARGLLWMRQPAPTFGKAHAARPFARILSLAARDLDPDFPVQEVSTGLPFLLIPLRGLEAVGRARLDVAAYERHFGKDPRPLFFFTGSALKRGHHLHARMFAPAFGIPEDPATGSANGCLAAWILRHGYRKGPAIDLKVEQGYEMGRPSLLRLKARRVGEAYDIGVGGKVIEVATGTLA